MEIRKTNPETKTDINCHDGWNQPLQHLFEGLQNDEALLVGGLHLTGSSSQNTTLLLAELRRTQGSVQSGIILTIKGIYNKVGNSASRTSNDALAGVFAGLGPLRATVTDAPCSLPPCLLCRLENCPGTDFCPDPQTLAMQQRWDKQRQARRKKKAPLDPTRFRLADFDLAENKAIRPTASIHAGNYTAAIRMNQLGRMRCFGNSRRPLELPFDFFSRLYAAHNLPERFALQKSAFLVGESRRYALWKQVWAEKLVRYAPESRYLRDPFEELELGNFYRNRMWFHCLGMLLYLRLELENTIPQ